MPLMDTPAAALTIIAVFGYLLGSFPSGLVLARLMGLGNLREIGSGNIGATNVLRTGSKTAAALTLLLDAGKGVLAVLLGRMISGEDGAQIGGLAAMLGHCYPVWLAFRGGKAVATFLGIMLALAWPVGLGCCAAWVIGAGTTRISSMGALTAAASCTIFLILFGYGSILLLGVVLTLLVFWRHRGNIQRIKAGTEPRIGQKQRS